MLGITKMQKQNPTKFNMIGCSSFPADVIQKLIDCGIHIDIVCAPYNLIDQRASLKVDIDIYIVMLVIVISVIVMLVIVIV